MPATTLGLPVSPMFALGRVATPRAAPHRGLVVMAVSKITANNSIGKKDFTDALVEKTNLSKTEAKKALDETLKLIEEYVSEGKKVSFVGFGSFTPKHRSARKARNPKTQEEMDIPATTVPTFTAGKDFKEKVKANGAV